MAGLVPAIHVFGRLKDVDARHKAGHDQRRNIGVDASSESGRAMMRRAAGAAMALCIACNAQAQTVRFKRFANPDDEKAAVFNRIYLAGVRDGLETVNASFVAQGAAPLFCPPATLVLTAEQTADMVTRTAAKATRNIDDLPISIILLKGLKEAYPCAAQSK